MDYISLFSGIGGFERAIHQTYPNAHCLGYCEIDDHPASVYGKHYPSHQRTRDVRDFRIEKNPNLLVAGFPCTDLSIARQERNGLSGEHSGLFYQLLRVLDEVKPKYWAVENVASMPDWERDKITLKLGVSPILLNAEDIWYCQRKRLFWTNFPVRNLSVNTLLPDFDTLLEPSPSKHLDLSTKEQAYMDSVVGGWRRWDKGIHNDTNNHKAKCLTSNLAKGVPNNVLVDRRFSPHRIRKLSPLECERLMGFPDNWTMWGKGKIVPDSRRYKMIGNSVCVPIVSHVMTSLATHVGYQK